MKKKLVNVSRDGLSAPAIVGNFYRGLFSVGKVAADNKESKASRQTNCLSKKTCMLTLVGV